MLPYNICITKKTVLELDVQKQYFNNLMGTLAKHAQVLNFGIKILEDCFEMFLKMLKCQVFLL